MKLEGKFFFIYFFILSSLELTAQNFSEKEKLNFLIKENTCDYNNPKPFYKKCDSIYSLCKKINYEEGELLCLQQKCNANLTFGNYNKVDFSNAIKLANKLNNYGIHASLLAMESYKKVDLGLYVEADRDLQEALALSEKIDIDKRSSIRRFVYNALGCLSQKNKSSFETIEHYCILAYRDAKLMANNNYILLETTNLAELYAFNKKRVSYASKFIQEADSISKIIEKKDSDLVQLNRVKGIYFFNLKKYNESIFYLNKSLEYSKNDYLNLDSYEALAKIYTAKNNLKKASEYFKKINFSKAKISDSEKKDVQDIYEEKVLSKNSASKPYLWIIFPILLLLLGFSLFLYFNKKIFRNNKKSNSILIEDETEEKFELLYNRIIELFENDFPYRDENYNISTLAESLNTNIVYISKAINKKRGINFKRFVNEYRINEIKKRLQQNEHKSYTFQSIYKSNGFSNQTTFNRVFKEIEGISPKKYVELLKS